MGLIEDLAGAGVPIEGFEKLDPRAGIVTEAIVAVDGSLGAKENTNLIEKTEEEDKNQQG
jgi:hypothetical protein